MDGSGVTQPVSGTFWQATQPVSAASLPLPTGAALESGGNLAAAATSLAVLDDWDESDRAKVNPIVGVAGVAAGAGSVGTTTQRVTLASDDPAVASLAILDDWDESDRCKVNPIAGQAGVQGGAGAVSATTQRIAIATDANAIDLAKWNGAAPTAAASLSDTVNNPTAPMVGSAAMLWDPVNSVWVRSRALHQGVLLTSGARTATTASAAFTNYDHSGVLVILDISANAGGATVQVFIQAYSPITATWINLHGTPTALGTVATTGHLLGHGAVNNPAATGAVFHVWQTHLPVLWRVNCVHANATSITYSVSYSYLK